MRIVVAMRMPSAGGGVRSYVDTIAEQIQRCGHDLTVFSRDDGDWRDHFDQRGVRSATRRADLPREVDVVLAQDQPSSYEMAELLSGVPQAFVWHGNTYDADMAPQLDGLVGLIVSLYHGPNARFHAASVKPPVLELTQPIAVARFTPTAPIGERPRRAVAISNYLTGVRQEIIERACAIAGIELELYGANQRRTALEPQIEINRSDIVFGKGRAAMEGMACGRAVYVYDFVGSDGWITPEKLPRLLVADPELIAAELADYSPAMGEVNRDLALANFSPVAHVARLITALENLVGDGAGPHNDAVFELGRLARASWSFESDVHILTHRLNSANHRLERLDAENGQLRRDLEHLGSHTRSVESSLRWRLVQGALRPLDKLRGRI
jgi:hypothetical protein